MRQTPDYVFESVEMLSDNSMKSLRRGVNKSGLIDSHITQKLHQAKPGHLFLLPSEFKDIKDVGNLSTRFYMEKGMMDETTLGVRRSQSIRKVTFGRVGIYSRGNTPVQTHIAAKPTRSVECAVREATASMLINDSELDMTAYAPIGFLRTENYGVTLLTRYSGQTLSFDNMLWLNPEDEYEDEVQDAIGKAAVSLATLHGGFHMTHGDSQPKNIAWDPKRDTPHAIDLEDARRHVGMDIRTLSEYATRDIATFMLTQYVLRPEEMFEHFADKYLDRYGQLCPDEVIPVTRSDIMSLRKQPLQTPFIVER